MRERWPRQSWPVCSPPNSPASPPGASMFRRLDPNASVLRLWFDGAEILARQGDSVAAALLGAGLLALRETPVSGEPRAPYCMMGVCFDCLVEIDGLGNRQACLTPARDGMVIRRQRGARGLG